MLADLRPKRQVPEDGDYFVDYDCRAYGGTNHDVHPFLRISIDLIEDRKELATSEHNIRRHSTVSYILSTGESKHLHGKRGHEV